MLKTKNPIAYRVKAKDQSKFLGCLTLNLNHLKVWGFI